MTTSGSRSRSKGWTAASTRVPRGAGLPGAVSERGSRPRAESARQPAGRESLAIRWFTPRGRDARAELLRDLRQEDGRHLAEIVGGLRRPGLPDERLDLRGIDLRGEDLAAIRLKAVDLSGADLRGCDLSCASLQGVDLSRADLRGARLRGACLRGARLQGADLRQTDLADAELCGALLDGARLGGARLHRARLWHVDLSRADLVGADLSSALTKAPARSQRQTRSPRRSAQLGRPPHTEPLRPPERVTGRATTRAAPAPQAGHVIPHATVRLRREERAREGLDFDAALAQLICLRGRVDRVTVVVEGEERVLFAAERPERGRTRRTG